VGCDLEEAAGRRRLAWTKQWLHQSSQTLEEEEEEQQPQQQQQPGHGSVSDSTGSWSFDVNADSIPAGFAEHWQLLQQLQLRQQQLELQFDPPDHAVDHRGVLHVQQQAMMMQAAVAAAAAAAAAASQADDGDDHDDDDDADTIDDRDSRMEWSYDSDNEEGGEFQCQGDEESEYESDDDLNDGPAPKGLMAEPRVFRNQLGIIYGFWSKAPLG
jgi:hypothetical protein